MHRRIYGRVDAHGGEYAVTLFSHAYYMPLVPRGSFWITSDDGVARTGFPITACRRSIAAAYLRWWGPIIAVLALAAPLAVGVPIAAVASALVAWSWTWRTLRGDLARQRSDWNLCAYNTRCDPARISPGDRGYLHARLAAYWRKHGFDRTPPEVARYGPTGVAEALLAYGLLRLDGADALADRLVLARHDAGGAARVVDVSADIADAVSVWKRDAPVDRDDLTRDWAELLSSDDAFAAAVSEARRSSTQRARAHEVIDAAQRRARDLLTGSLLLVAAACVLALAAWMIDTAADRTSLLLAAAATTIGATAMFAIGLRAERRTRAALAALADRDARSTN